MKKLAVIVSTLFVLLISQTAMAAWTIVTTIDSIQGDNFVVKAVCTSDGNALTATDLIEKIVAASSGYSVDAAKELIKGSQARLMIVSPGTTTVAPDNTLDITLSDAYGTVFSVTGASNTADSTQQLWATTGDFINIVSVLNLAMNDIGGSGDKVTLYFKCAR